MYNFFFPDFLSAFISPPLGLYEAKHVFVHRVWAQRVSLDFSPHTPLL